MHHKSDYFLYTWKIKKIKFIFFIYEYINVLIYLFQGTKCRGRSPLWNLHMKSSISDTSCLIFWMYKIEGWSSKGEIWPDDELLRTEIKLCQHRWNIKKKLKFLRWKIIFSRRYSAVGEALNEYKKIFIYFFIHAYIKIILKLFRSYL